MFFNGWEPLIHVLVMGPLSYVALVVLLRSAGKRTLSKMNAFDFVVTIALGSVLASAVVSPEVSLAAGVLAFATLIAMQFLVTFLSVRWSWFQQVVKAQPSLLFHNGEFHEATMRRCRVTREELLAAVRESNIASMHEVLAIVLETDSSVSVLERTDREPTALETVRDQRNDR